MSQAPNLDWLNAFVQLGKGTKEGYAPLGAGFLVVDERCPWLITARTALDRCGDDELLAWLGQPGVVVGVSQALAGSGLGWVLDEALNLAACPFPLDPAWNARAFSRDAALPSTKLLPTMAACALGSPYGFDLPGRPPVLTLEGAIAGVDLPASRLFTSAPLLPQNVGAPLLVLTAPLSMGGSAMLAGIMAQTMPVRRPVEGVMVPPHLVPTQLHLSLAHPADRVFELLRSPAADAQWSQLQSHAKSMQAATEAPAAGEPRLAASASTPSGTTR